MYNRVFCIPSHRKILDEFLISFFEEVEYINRKLNCSCPLIIFEDTIENINKENIKKIKERYPQNIVHYITRKEVVQFYNLINQNLTNKSKQIFKKLYPNDNVNYGNVFNRIFLFATLFGADFIHRRDSDIAVDIDKNGNILYPSKIEVDVLGKSLDGKIAYISGSGYKGKYSLDIDDLIIGDDYSLIKDLCTCMSIPEEYHKEVIETEFLGNNLPHLYDQITHNSDSHPECGNLAMYKLHHYFPSSTQDFIIGSDYFFLSIAIQGGLDLVYHNRANIHKHTPDRTASLERILNYWRGLLMMIDSQIFYRKLYENFNFDLNNKETLKNSNKIISNNMKILLDIFPMNFANERNKKMLLLIDILSKSQNKNVQKIAPLLAQQIDDVKKITEISIKDHIELLKAWPEIIKNVINLRYDPKAVYIMETTLI